jgi:nitroreductase
VSLIWRLDMIMEDSQVLRAIQGRRSAREFLDTPVEMATVKRIVEAGRLAASGANR